MIYVPKSRQGTDNYKEAPAQKVSKYCQQLPGKLNLTGMGCLL